MFIAEAIADFSNKTMLGNQEENEQEIEQHDQNIHDDEKELQSKKRDRTAEHNEELQRNEEKEHHEQVNEQQNNQEPAQEELAIKYSEFFLGDKVLVKETYENGWWLGHPVGKPELEGFFPSNYVKVGIKPPAPPPPKKKVEKNEEAPEFDPNQGTDWIKKELEQIDEINTGPVKSDYYQGIKSYKMVKIDEKNQNILKGNHVKFDVATGLAKVPVKDQAPTAKAVRQMGYYFDYHQWNETKNQNPLKKARPDIRKKKEKKLRLKMMD